LHDFKGNLLREEHIERFKQLLWRPRPPTMLTKEEQKKIRKNLREYSKVFDEQDFNKKNLANKAVIDQRRRLLDEWRAWRSSVEERLEEEPGYKSVEQKEEDAGGEVVEEIVEEIIEETEEIVP
jgi:translation initiation factor 3 subunit B